VDVSAQNALVSSAPSATSGTAAQWNTWFSTLVGGTVKVGIANPDSDPAGYRGWLTLELADENYNLGTGGTDTVGCTYTPPFTSTNLCVYEQSEDTSASPTVTAPGNWIPLYTHDLYFVNSGSLLTGAHAAALVGPLETGTLNFLFMYKSLAVSSGLSYISLPTAVNLGSTTAPTDPYNGVEYISPTGLTTQSGGVIELFLTVPTDSTNIAASNAYVQYVVSNYKTLLANYAISPLTSPALFVESGTVVVPTGVQNAITGYSGCATLSACTTTASF